LSTDTDPVGNPIAKLHRGVTLILPTSDEVSAYREKHGLKEKEPAEDSQLLEILKAAGIH
jgi:hypothetical protein